MSVFVIEILLNKREDFLKAAFDCEKCLKNFSANEELFKEFSLAFIQFLKERFHSDKILEKRLDSENFWNDPFKFEKSYQL